MTNLGIDRREFEFIKPLSWDGVFGRWSDLEADRPNWIEHYKSKGFSSWEEWRTTEIVEPLKLAERKWRLYRILDPTQNIPRFRGGPFKGWVERFYEGRSLPTFAELAKHQGIQTHKGINEIITNFPKESLLIAVVTNKGIVILEGMHRCCAIALAASQSFSIEANIDIALAEYEGDITTVFK